MIKVAVSYKGKHFIIHDENCVDLDWDIIDPYIDMEYVLSEDGLQEHVASCLYYGIPPYIGHDKYIHSRIEEIQQRIENNND